VFREGRAVALIDWDFAAPGRPVYDLAQMARMWRPGRRRRERGESGICGS